MNRLALTLAACLPAAALALFAGCNGAQYNVPPAQDAGPPCLTLNPVIHCPDAGDDAAALTPPAACTAEPTSSDPTVALIPTGNYPASCTVQFYFDGFGGQCSAALNPCTCLPATDAGAAQWSNCADAGINYSP